MSRPVMHAFRLMSSLSSSISEPCAALNMATPLPSLVDSDARTLAAAPFLFLPGELEAEFIGDPAMQGQYSGERLHAERPEIYAEVINMLGQGCSIRSIKRRCKVHHRTIEAVRIREGDTIDTLRKRMGRSCFSLANVVLESLEEDVAAGILKPEAKAFAAGMLLDKAQLLTGGVTERVERVTAPDGDSVRDYINSLPAASTPGMGLQAGEEITVPIVRAADPSALADSPVIDADLVPLSPAEITPVDK